MLKQLKVIKFYALLVAGLLGLFVWSGLSGTWFTGDDLESVEKNDGKGFHSSSGSRYRGGRSGFYHK
jgi:hypothetical protein